MPLDTAAPQMLEALREVVGAVCDGPSCLLCDVAEGEPHEPDCTMHFVLDAIAAAEAR